MKGLKGLSLIELTVIVAILGITALVVIPDFSSTDPQNLELAANRLAEALRYARSESIRSGEIHAVRLDNANQDASFRDILVFRVDLGASPFGVAEILKHPLSKQPYDLWLDASMARGVAFASSQAPFTFAGILGSTNTVHFNAMGMPVWVEDGTFSRMLNGDIQLSLSQRSRTLSIQPLTGGITVQ